MTADATHPMFESGSRVRLTKVVYAALFLIVTSGLFYALLTEYSIHLVSTKRFRIAETVEEYFALAQSLFFFAQLSIILFFFRPAPQIADYLAVRRPDQSVFRNIWLGLLAGVTALVATLPSFIGHRGSSGMVKFLVDHLSIGAALGFVLLLVVLLPFAQAIFFNGILLRQLLESISVVSALIVSTLVLMLSWPAMNSWPVFYLIAGAALGLATGIVFWQTKSVLACAVAHASFTIGAIMLQLWRMP
jgi:membrane protease YdiL (CAAX protease family)